MAMTEAHYDCTRHALRVAQFELRTAAYVLSTSSAKGLNCDGHRQWFNDVANRVATLQSNMIGGASAPFVTGR